MKPTHKSGAAIAIAAAALIVAVAAPMGVASANNARGKCIGANACKGKGYLELTKAGCNKIPGTRFRP